MQQIRNKIKINYLTLYQLRTAVVIHSKVPNIFTSRENIANG